MEFDDADVEVDGDAQAWADDPPADRRDVAERADRALEDDRLTADGGESADTSEDRTRPRHLSPSSSSMYEQCPRKWKHRYLDRLPDPPGVPALAGTFAHRVLELLLQLPPGKRTVDEAKRLARRAWPETLADPDFQALALDDAAAKAFRWRGWLAVQGLWNLEDPNAVTVHATEHDVRVEIEGVPFRGIVDRIDSEPDGLVIADYKSGRAPSGRFAADRLGQVLLYATAVRAMTGQRPVRARLLYLGQRIIGVDATEQSLDTATASLVETWSSLTSDCERSEFDAKVGPLCAWCPFVNVCAEGQAEVKRRASAGLVRHDAPGLVVLAEAS